MKKINLLALFILTINIYNAQNTSQDTIDNPYWIDMMSDPTINFFKTKRAYDLYFSNKPKVKGTGFKQFERWAENAKTSRINADGSFKPADHVQTEIAKFQRNNLQARSNNGDWSCLGPFTNPGPSSMARGVGRIGDIAFHPTDANTIYLGASVGGFWYTTNKGQSWKNGNTDNIPSLGISSIAVCPVPASEPVIIIGSGDRAANDAPGLGTYISLDGGINFTKSNTGMGNVTVNEMVVNPINSNTIYAATSSGIYRSFNQGKNWALCSPAQNFKDIKYSPDDTMVLYAATSGSFYRCTNGGTIWTAVNSGLSSNGRNRIAIAVTAANPNIVYLVASKTNNSVDAVYKSSNRGQSFVVKSTSSNLIGTQGWYAIAIESSGTDSNVVFVGGLDMYRSINGGATFSKVSNWTGGSTWIHADFHHLSRNPINNDLFIGTDGGVDYSTNDYSTPMLYNNINNGLAISMFYNLGVSQSSKTKFITGAQDNGTSAGSSSSDWTAELGGDGMQCEVSNLDTTVMFGSLYYGAISRSKNNGQFWGQITSGPPSNMGGINETGPWVTPFHIHPRNHDIMVTVFQNVWISKNVVTANTPTFAKATTGVTGNGTAVRFSNANDSVCFTGWDNGAIRVCNNLFASTPAFIPIGSSTFGSGQVNDIETSYNDKNILYVAKGSKIFKSSNLGTSWVDISLNLPNITIHSIALHKFSKEGLYVGTSSGVYYKDSAMTAWVPYSNGLTLNAQVRDLEIVHDLECGQNSKLYAATYGRGLWITNTYSDTANLKLTLNSDKGNKICQGEKLTITCDGGTIYNFNANSDITQTGLNTFEITANTSNQYQIYSKNSNGECEIRNFDLTVNPKPTLIANPKLKTVAKGTNAILNVSGATDYEWTPNKYIIGVNSGDQINVKPDTTITYTIKGTSVDGCINTTTVKITVTGTGSISNITDEINIYPNPTQQELIIQSIAKTSFEILNQESKKVIIGNNSNFEHNIDVSKLANGIYFIHLKDMDGKMNIMKFTILR